MLNFAPVQRGERAMNDLAASLTLDDLQRFTNASVDALLGMLDALTDADVTFVPDDPEAEDTAAAAPTERHLAWTLGHVVVHTTASAEEYAAVAAALARGVPFHGRPRYETPWQRVTTLTQCRQRLAESRRMRIASLSMWPDVPHLDNGLVYWEGSGWVNAKGIFVWGLAHDSDHRCQIEKIAAQATAAHRPRG